MLSTIENSLLAALRTLSSKEEFAHLHLEKISKNFQKRRNFLYFFI